MGAVYPSACLLYVTYTRVCDIYKCDNIMKDVEWGLKVGWARCVHALMRGGGVYGGVYGGMEVCMVHGGVYGGMVVCMVHGGVYGGMVVCMVHDGVYGGVRSSASFLHKRVGGCEQGGMHWPAHTLAARWWCVSLCQLPAVHRKKEKTTRHGVWMKGGGCPLGSEGRAVHNKGVGRV